MNIISMYFSQWIIVDNHREDIWYSAAYALSMLLVALSMPILGAISDQARQKKPFLLVCTLLCILCTATIGIASFALPPGDVLVLTALGLFIIANYFYEGGIVFYNSLLTTVSQLANLGRVSGLGVALGYVGSITGLLLVLPFVQGKIALNIWGFQFQSGRQAAFLPTAFFFLVFSLPVFLLVREVRKRKIKVSRLHAIAAFRRVKQGLLNTQKYPGVTRFLIADFMIEDAIATVILYMAVFLQKVVGFPDIVKTKFFIITTICAVIGSYLCGIVVDKIGPKRALAYVVWGWLISLLVIAINPSEAVIWLVGGAIGIFLGSTWTASRPLLATLVPSRQQGQFFGLYSLSGRAAAIIGPLIWGICVLIFKNDSVPIKSVIRLLDLVGLSLSSSTLATIEYRIAICFMAIIMVCGLIIFQRVPDKFNLRTRSV